MEIRRISAVGNSCNFCKRGVIEGNYLKFPYTEVTLIKGGHNGGITVFACDQCLTEIKNVSDGI